MRVCNWSATVRGHEPPDLSRSGAWPGNRHSYERRWSVREASGSSAQHQLIDIAARPRRQRVTEGRLSRNGVGLAASTRWQTKFAGSVARSFIGEGLEDEP